MVRTYTFNPSTQSSLSASLPALPSAAVFGHSASLRRRAVPSAVSPQIRHHLPPPDPPLRNGNASKASFSSDAFSPAATASVDRRQVMVEEEPTTFIGIRSVLINGQRFFQPLSVPPNALSPSASVSSVDPMAPLLALSAANNGQCHPKQQTSVSNVPFPLPSLPPAPFIRPQCLASDGEENPPWLRGNPQPKNGLRSHAWHETLEGEKAKGNLGASFGSELGEWIETNKAAAKEKHRMELMAQIEEKRQREMRERQREWEMEEKERMKDELYQQRMRMELEEEKRREREKALLTELKMAKLAVAQKATEEAIRAAKSRENNPQQGKDGAPQGQTNHSAHFFESNETTTGHQQQHQQRHREEEGEEQLEWWERKDRRKQMEEAKRRGEGPKRTTSRDSRRRSDGGRQTNGSSRNGQNGYEPTLITRQRTIDTDNGRRVETLHEDDHFYGRQL